MVVDLHILDVILIAWMDSIIGSVGRLGKVKVRNDDDLIDRMNHLYTTGILIIFTVVYVRKFLKIMDRIGSTPDKKLANRFTVEYLRHDGVFTLRLIGKNSSDIVVAEIVSGLWDMYRSKKSIQIRSNGHDTEGEDV
ncbi:innexin unc-9-like isoform X2 [Octopus vulgaris]|uniref:Innexin unc-9-like isoform X2 n=1 Tax=Octopus vulgaris TaxID=6645 RepID=A0AA36AIX3_OCTVU|nr:innexin unc-9-like isoform X2 [Octopus vulgaris]